MPFNASGVFQRLFNWRNDRDAGIKILAERMDQEMDGIVAGINDVVQGEIDFKGPIAGVYGTAAAPAFSFQEDPDTGVYRSGTNKLAASAGGTKVLELRQDEVEALVNFKKGTFAIDGNFVSFEDGDHWITYDESGHDFGLRAGNKRSGSNDVITSNGHGAVAVSLNHQAADPEFKVRIGNSGALGATVTWAKELVAKASGVLTWGGHTIWHAGNDGPGSNLDADKLDGLHATSFLRTDQTSTMDGQLIGGMGALNTDGTLDWNHVTNARSGNGHSLLLGSASNGPGGAGYFHPFSFEYNSKNGNGNMTQFAVPHSGTDGPYFRTRYQGAWADWREIWHSQNHGAGSGLDADKLDGYHAAHFLPAASYTANDVLTKIKTVDGSGSELDADLLDGQHATYFATAAALTALQTEVDSRENSWDGLRSQNSHGYIDLGPANAGFAHIHTDRPYFYFNKQLQVNGQTVWNTGNDGAGSGMDADKLDGLHAASFLRSDTFPQVPAALTGGIGAVTTGGTADWNHSTNARSGQGHTLLLGTAANGPGGATYYHPFSFEYSSKNGNGNMTQFAIPYSSGFNLKFRNRYQGAWSGWQSIAMADYNAIGSHAFLFYHVANAAIVAGSTYAGSSLYPAAVSSNSNSSSSGNTVLSGTNGQSSMSGTWRALGGRAGTPYTYPATLFVRIA